MGKEWLTWVGGRGGGRFSGGCRGKMSRKMKDAATSAGCMCAVFQLLHFQSPSNHHHHHNTTISKLGVEAPRNSLESNQPPPPPCIRDDDDHEEEEQTNLPVGNIQIKTRRKDDECSLDSPAGTKTPSLVARLMGLDLLPECTSPSTIKSRLNPNLLRSINGAARSLPETPRTSLARRSDAEYHTPRLSLQIHKENVFREFEFSEKLSRPRARDENASPGSSARHFVEQVKDRVSRRRGVAALADITNHIDNGGQARTRRRDGNLIPAKAKPTKIRQSGTKTRRVSENSANDSRVIIRPLQEQRLSKKFGSGDKKGKSKRTPLLSDPNLLQIKKSPSPPPTKLPQKQSQASEFKQTHRKILSLPTGSAAAIPGGATAEYGDYIQKILKRAGIIDESDLFTSAKPIDPSIFHYLELFHPIIAAGGGGNAILRHRCNRKLIFHLVNEFMSEISRPHFNSNPWVSPVSGRDVESPMVDDLCKRIGGFPAVSGPVLEDVDSLVERDLRELESKEMFREEESVVCEIEREIVESLLRETAAMAARVRRRKSVVGDGCHVAIRYWLDL